MSGRLEGIGISALLPILFTGCGDGRPDLNNNQTGCPEGHRAEGPACVPIFDDPEDCPDPSEMPALGGGCLPVGVPACATGFVSDGEGGCEPILPPSPGPGIDPCPAGTMEMIGLTECQPVGVPGCAEGFVPDGEGGCDAILPPGPDPCPPGTIEQLGHDTCQPLGDCGPDPSEGGSPWGLVEVDGTTVYVDSTADASGANGTAAAPFPTIAAALTAAQPGGQVAIAAGEYEEAPALGKPVRMAGRCSGLVTLRGRLQLGQPRPALSITAEGSGSEVRGLTLTGPGVGLQVSGAQQVVLEEVEVLGTVGYGVLLTSQTQATLRRSKVAGCTLLGIASQDSTLRVEESVVQGTLPEPGTGSFGRGIVGQCTLQGACGSLHVEKSLVTGNRDAGIFASGVGLTVISSVVRDTLPEEGDLRAGRGISVQCNEALGACSTLALEGSLVTGNREMGLYAAGVDVTVASSVVRDTLPEERSGIFGRGISAECNQSLGVCGSLLVEESLVAGNSEVGISAFGAGATVVSSVVKGTQPRQSDQSRGRGIAAQCDPGLGACGALRVEGSLVSGNRDAGIFAAGSSATVVSSVVRDTQSQASDLERGRGLSAQCDEQVDACGALLVDGCLVTGNRDMGIFASGVDARVASSVVRDTLARESDQTFGNGINAQCHLESAVCGTLRVEGSLVTGNLEVGIIVWGIDATVASSVVRDTLPQASDLKAGVGIAAQCDPDLGACGTLRVEASLVARSRDVGIMTWGTSAEVVSSVVVDTLPRESDQAFGRGINAQCDPDLGACGNLHVEASLVERSEDVGIFLYGVPAELLSVAVIDTQPNSAGPWNGAGGQGIWARCHGDTGPCGSLSMTSSLVVSSHAAGVALEGISGFMIGSLVDTALAQPLDGKYGYGVQIGGREGQAIPTFHIRECEVRDARLVGVIYYRSMGTLSRSVVSGGEYSVAMNEGSSPTFGDDNQLSGTVTNDPQWVSLYPSPAPPPTTPVGVLE